ncbi:MAG: LLM class flavin-dependent oxidoreductase [Acidimicrobiales bacterium]|nr:LLM class flavin-dependent oxidoreductase [Acidimicrobiales bacterium]
MAFELGLNRWDWRTAASFADGVVEAEALGIGHAFLPVNPLAVGDPYVFMAAAAARTRTIGLAPLLETPALRPAAVAAGSIATVDEVSGGRAMLVYGIGDTAVRWLGLRPATVAQLERATADARALLAGGRLEVGAAAPAWLRHARPVPVWVAAGGPRTLRMAGRVADGVFLRVGTHPTNLRTAIDQVHAGAAEAGRDPGEVGIGLIVHTVRSQAPAEVRAITRSMAAGFYEYSPALYTQAGLEWRGTPVEELKRRIWPDFHHADDLVAAGALVDFLDDEVAASFSFSGTTDDVAAQLRAALAAVPEASIVVPHPVPLPDPEELRAYTRWLGEDLRPSIG